jgi:hypothetical protein
VPCDGLLSGGNFKEGIVGCSRAKCGGHAISYFLSYSDPEDAFTLGSRHSRLPRTGGSQFPITAGNDGDAWLVAAEVDESYTCIIEIAETMCLMSAF